ncbi:hypothetical protein [Hymenobacter elongatus]|uniref:Preprotein translocase subunit SecB n=1 Tax=Hymenobacter elongatus TaxID=877208 RepID=A0A4Z0PP28_9BACT|nr:hypothetical protein [Hymenobacter elongatus]TGE18949.1 hypothetical protein E5J99_04190 [Hymenobacter elongatus]
MPAPAPVLSQIHLVSGVFIECAILNEAPDTYVKLGTQRFQIYHNVSPSFSIEEEYILIDLTVHCQPMEEDDQPSPVKGRFRLHLTFLVENLRDYLEAAPEAPQQPPLPSQQLILTLTGVAYSTARGMIAAKTSDTILQPFVLPLLDVRDLVRPKTTV